MPLQSGQVLAHYKIQDKLGEGGMGEVYRAHDGKLGRDVAIKVLPPAVASDPDRLARFQREAQVLASLNHPNIGAIYGFEEVESVRFLVLELVQGEDLAKRLERGAFPVGEALPVALAIAQALEAAHEKGIIHRDLKPGNVVLTPEGSVKVLDFGLAKALDPGGDSSTGASPTMSPTLTSAGTVAGMILGTAAYMSPEQAKGKHVDRRCDIWAFGVTLFEMLTATKLFTGETISETLARVMMAEPDLDRLPAGTPQRIRRLLERCLVRDPRSRLQDVGEARIALERTLAGEADDEAHVAGSRGRAGWWVAGAAAVLALVAGFVAGRSGAPDAPRAPLRKFEVVVPEPMSGQQIALSNDGTKLAYSNDRKLWIRSLDRLEPRAVEAPDGAGYPFWSPDDTWLGFVSGEKIWKVRTDGGQPVAVTEIPDPYDPAAGTVWTEDDRLIFSTGDSAVLEVSALGGDWKVLQEIAGPEGSHSHDPSGLPGGRGILYVIHDVAEGINRIAVLADGKEKIVVHLEGQTLAGPVYSPPGYLLYHRTPDNPGIWAAPFSLDDLEVTGEPFLVTADGSGAAVSSDGTLAYIGGSSNQPPTRLAVVDGTGTVTKQIGDAEVQSAYPVVSPDGRLIAVVTGDTQDTTIWIRDVERGTKTRLTFDERDVHSVCWHPDGDRVFYSAGLNQAGKIYWRAVDGSGDAQEVADGVFPFVTRDGRYVVYSAFKDGHWDLFYRDLDDEGGEPVAIFRSDAIEFGPRVSPDGRWVAYISLESERAEVYVKKFPSGEGKWQISTDGGEWPLWSPDGRKLYYTRGNDVMVVDIDADAGRFRPGTPRRLFARQDSGTLTMYGLDDGVDVFPDGEHFAIVLPGEEGQVRRRPPSITVVENWIEEFEGR